MKDDCWSSLFCLTDLEKHPILLLSYILMIMYLCHIGFHVGWEPHRSPILLKLGLEGLDLPGVVQLKGRCLNDGTDIDTN